MKKWVLLSHPHKGSTWAQVPEILIHWFVLRQSTPCFYLYCVQVVVALRADLGGEVEDLAMVTSVLAVVHIKDNICPIPTQVR